MDPPLPHNDNQTEDRYTRAPPPPRAHDVTRNRSISFLLIRCNYHSLRY